MTTKPTRAQLEALAKLPCWDRMMAPWIVQWQQQIRAMLETYHEQLQEHGTVGTSSAVASILGLIPGFDADAYALAERVTLDYVMYQIHTWGRPIWRLDETCAQALAETDPPFSEVSMADLGKLKLPFPGFVLALPPGFELVTYNSETVETNQLGLEALFLAEDYVHERPGMKGSIQRQTGPVQLTTRVIHVFGVGRCRGVLPDGGLDDMLQLICISEGMAPDGGPNWPLSTPEAFKVSTARIIRLAVNFLLALNAGYLEQVKQPGTTKKNPAKVQQEARRGIVTSPHTLIRLGAKCQRTEPRSVGSSPGPQKAAHFVRGHWHCYWVAEPEEGALILAEAEGKRSKLFKVTRWIYPFQRGGMGPVASPKYRVRA